MGRPSKLPLILEALSTPKAKKRGLTYGEIKELAGVSRGCVEDQMPALRVSGQVYISGWLTEGKDGKKCGRYQASYKLGSKPDTPKPAPLTTAEISRRHRARAIKSGEIEDMRADRRSYWWRKQPAKRDPLVAALFGA